MAELASKHKDIFAVLVLLVGQTVSAAPVSISIFSI
jgi:hypothetical protein